MGCLKLVTIFTFASLTTAQYVGYQHQPSTIQTQPSLTKVLPVPEYIQQAPRPEISYTLQLPSLENPVPFYNPEIDAELKPPGNSYADALNYYEFPVPSQHLQVPPVGEWNPNNDPSLYYDTVVDFTQPKQPTNLHPKKFNKEIHDKVKQYQPKQEIEISPFTIEELSRQLKANDKLEKHENRQQVEKEKSQQAVQI